MSELGLNDEELKLVAALARDDASKASRLGFYAAAILPTLLLGSYGILKPELVSLGLAFAGLLLFFVWHISRELQYLKPTIGVFQKIAAHERRAEVNAQRSVEADNPAPGGPAV
jgi:hypothetical protein